jgi:hypothetical protein
MKGSAVLRGALLVLAVFNLLDGVNSCVGLSIGVIDENNPLMRAIWNVSPFLFLGIKFALSILLIVLGLRPLPASLRPTWRVSIYSLVLIYGLVIGLHAVWMVRAAGA